MRAIIAGLALALLIASPVAARQTYTIALDGFTLDSVTGWRASFDVTRAQTGNNPVAWVAVRCDTSQSDAVVIWGTSASLVGTATAPVSGSCTARVTTTPWQKAKPWEPSVTFTTP